MTNEWKENTCETCIFQVDEQCRKYPPIGKTSYDGILYAMYPIVKVSNVSPFMGACAEYKELSNGQK